VQIKILALMRGIILGFILASLAACSGNSALEGRFQPDPALSPSGSGVVTPLPADNPESAIPSEIPRYPNAQLMVERSNASPDRGSIVWTSSDPVNLVEQYYLSQLPQQNWQISQPFSQTGDNLPLIASKKDFSIRITLATANNNTELTIDYKREAATVSPSPSVSAPTSTPNLPINSGSVNLDKVPEPLRQPIQDIVALGVIPAQSNFNSLITRQEFAQWLVAANNKFFANTPGKQIRLGSTGSQPAFSDVPASNPAFAEIQGLAEAGLIPSPLTGDASANLFRPNALLSRENLIDWKIRLDLRKSPPAASIDSIKETWGFQDAAKIDPKVLRSLYADFQNSDQANVKRVFGFTTLFQPKKPVTKAEAAAALSYFGYQGDGLSATEARQILSQPSPTPSATQSLQPSPQISPRP
jgi:hypothetical protein